MNSKETLFDRLTRRVKNSKLGVAVLFLAISLGAIAQFSGALSGVVQQFYKPTPPVVIDNIELPAYAIMDRAFPTKNEARQRIVELGWKGYSKTGFVWIPNFEYLSGKELYQVYIGPFKDKDEAINALCRYNKEFNMVTYGLKLSDKPGREEFRCSDYDSK